MTSEERQTNFHAPRRTLSIPHSVIQPAFVIIILILILIFEGKWQLVEQSTHYLKFKGSNREKTAGKWICGQG